MKPLAMLLAGLGLLALAPAWAAGVPEIPYDSVPSFLKFPAGVHLGEASGVAVNSKKHVFVYHRGSIEGPAYGAIASQLLEFGPDGKFIREIGKGLYAFTFAHDVRIDQDDNIWAIDKGSDMIVKFNQAGDVMMVFGRKKESTDDAAKPWTFIKPPRPHQNGQFRQPTDVAWDREGNIFISDGYVNSRVAKFSKDGDWVKSFGAPGNKPGEFDTPHGIANDAEGNIYVADRGNKRIQVFDSDGKFLREIRFEAPIASNTISWYGDVPTDSSPVGLQAHAPWTVCVSPGPTQYIYTSDSFPGRIYKLTLDGKLVGVLGRAGHQLKQFGGIHQIACPSENELYVAEIYNWRVQKLLLHPDKGTSTK